MSALTWLALSSSELMACRSRLQRWLLVLASERCVVLCPLREADTGQLDHHTVDAGFRHRQSQPETDLVTACQNGRTSPQYGRSWWPPTLATYGRFWLLVDLLERADSAARERRSRTDRAYPAVLVAVRLGTVSP